MLVLPSTIRTPLSVCGMTLDFMYLTWSLSIEAIFPYITKTRIWIMNKNMSYVLWLLKRCYLVWVEEWDSLMHWISKLWEWLRYIFWWHDVLWVNAWFTWIWTINMYHDMNHEYEYEHEYELYLWLLNELCLVRVKGIRLHLYIAQVDLQRSYGVVSLWHKDVWIYVRMIWIVVKSDSPYYELWTWMSPYP